jgi:multiple sugar transport system permease protein
MTQELVQVASTGSKVHSNRSLFDILDHTFQHWALAPALILLILLTLYPALNLLRMSISRIEFVGGTDVWTFDAASNFRLFAQDWVFRTALKNTLIFVVAVVFLQMVLGFALALLARGLTAGKGFIRTIMVLPILVPAVAIGSMWKLMFNFEFGIFNQVIAALGLTRVDWLGSTSVALISVIIVDIWHWVPFVFLILLAGLEALPIDIYEAAEVDGANRWQSLRYITVPMMWPSISVALMFRIVLAFKVFDEIFLLTSGGPGTSTEVVSLLIYKVFFQQSRMGYGALLSIVTILIICVFVFTYRRANAEGR